MKIIYIEACTLFSWFHEISSKISWKAAISILFSTNFLTTFSQILLFRNWTTVDWTRFHGWTRSYSWPTSQWKSWRCCEICKSFWNKTQNGQDNSIWWVQYWPAYVKKVKTTDSSKHINNETGWSWRNDMLNLFWELWYDMIFALVTVNPSIQLRILISLRAFEEGRFLMSK